MNSLGWFRTAATAIATIIVLATSSHVNPEVISALMMESLRNNLVQACEDEQITLHCPKNTQILLGKIFYGRVVPRDQLCPSLKTKHKILVNEDISCYVMNAHRKILEQCRNKRKCKIIVKPTFFGIDPCPNTSKYLQISYKCKPVSFDEESFCEGSTMQLNCKQNKRLVIYSAHYGRTVERQMLIPCASNTSINQDCVIDVLGRVLYHCHAQTECKVVVDDEHFDEAGCKKGMQKYLSLIFMCMNDEIFSEAALEGNLETMKEIISNLYPWQLQKVKKTFVEDDRRTFHIKDEPGYGFKTFQKVSFPKKNKNVGVIMNSLLTNSYVESGEDTLVTATPSDTTTSKVLPFNASAFLHDIALTAQTVKDNKEKALLCLLLSLLGGLTTLLVACVISGCWRRKMKRKNSNSKSNENIMRVVNPAESSTLLGSNSVPVFLHSDNRICSDIGDLLDNKESFLRLTRIIPSRKPQNIRAL